jgi:hypothetical protein
MSAEEARKLGFLRPTDRVVANADHLLYEAKQTVLAMVQEGWKPPRPRLIPVAGDGGRAAIKYMANTMRQGGYITEYEEFIAGKLAYILTGGDVLAGAMITEQQMLDLEREAFVSLCGEKKTQERITMVRREEALNAARLLEAELIPLGELDLRIDFDDRTRMKVTELIKKYQPSVVITCAYEGGHWIMIPARSGRGRQPQTGLLF